MLKKYLVYEYSSYDKNLIFFDYDKAVNFCKAAKVGHVTTIFIGMSLFELILNIWRLRF